VITRWILFSKICPDDFRLWPIASDTALEPNVGFRRY
jgi:hypothetical protein